MQTLVTTSRVRDGADLGLARRARPIEILANGRIMKKKSTSYIEAMGVKYPATCKGLMAAIKAIPAGGGTVLLRAGVSIRIPKEALPSLGIRVTKASSES